MSDSLHISNKFPKSARLLKRSEFLRAQGQGRKFHGRYFWISVIPTPRDLSEGEEGSPNSVAKLPIDKADGARFKEALISGSGHNVDRHLHRGVTSRFGFTISKKTLKSSVKRNKVRRRLREAVRLARSRIRGGFDVVLVAKTEADGVGFRELADELHLLLGKAKLWVANSKFVANSKVAKEGKSTGERP